MGMPPLPLAYIATWLTFPMGERVIAAVSWGEVYPYQFEKKAGATGGVESPWLVQLEGVDP